MVTSISLCKQFIMDIARDKTVTYEEKIAGFRDIQDLLTTVTDVLRDIHAHRERSKRVWPKKGVV